MPACGFFGRNPARFKRRRREIIGVAVRLQSNTPARGRFRRTPLRRGTYRSLVRRRAQRGRAIRVFAGRSSDSASSPWPLLGMITNGLWPRLHFTAAVLSETCTPFPILPLARAVPERRRSGTCKYPCILLCLKYSICLSVLQYPLSRRERGCAVHHAAQPLPETWELFH